MNICYYHYYWTYVLAHLHNNNVEGKRSEGHLDAVEDVECDQVVEETGAEFYKSGRMPSTFKKFKADEIR